MSDSGNEEFRGDELINIKLSRDKYEVLKNMIEREQSYSRLTGMLKSSWLWVVGGGILTFYLLWDRFLHIGVK